METWHVNELVIEAHHPQVLRSDAETRAIAIQLPAGEELSSHQVHERTYLIVVAGEVEICQDDGSVEGGAGLLAHFAPNERRTIKATTDARVVMVLAPWPGEGHPSAHAG
ncbi:MAG TPA: cupin domain-containing protein [Solirubrobacteraceae bacterium]|jgi:quercetin dioxygenase-like cupin family protein|nr:cupin domain-containing protein [Solirubrobacteraceae bacterium]